MNRYLSSFIISLSFYIAAIVALFFIFTQNSYGNTEVKTQSVQKINFSIITPPKAPIPKPKNKPKTKPKPIPKPEPKPIPEPEPKPIPEPEQEPEPIVEEEIPQEEVLEEEVIEDQKVEEIISDKQSNANTDAILAKQNIFIEDLVKRINSNKSYPNMARRRCIEGLVDVKFKIFSDGSVKDIIIISGRSIFKKSAIEAIAKSFPITIDSTLFDFPKEFKIKIAYILK